MKRWLSSAGMAIGLLLLVLQGRVWADAQIRRAICLPLKAV